MQLTHCPFCLVFVCLESPQATAMNISAASIVHLPPGVLLGTFMGMDNDLTWLGTRIIAEIQANYAIFVSCELCK